MKRSRALSQMTAGAVAFLLAACAAACPVTGFELNANLGKLVTVIFCFSVFCAFSLTLRHGALIPLGLMALAAGFLWRDGQIIDQTQSLLLNITTRFDRAYGTGVLCAGAANGASGPVELPLLALGCFGSFVISWAVSRGKSFLYSLLTTLPMLVVCLVITDSPPHPLALFGLLTGLGLLLMTDHVRREKADAGSRLLRMLALPMAAVLGILFLIQPPSNYVNRAEDFQGQLISWAEQLQSLAEDVRREAAANTGDPSGTDQLNLRTLGPRTQWDYAVMKVTAPVSGTLYLRGQDFNTYSGTGWIASRHRSEVFPGGTDEIGPLTIETYGVKDVLYTPYYPGGDITMVGGNQPNGDRLKTYSFLLTELPKSTATVSVSGPSTLLGSSTTYPDSSYRLLPADTLRWARDLAARITDGKNSIRDQAAAIAAHVRASASYDLRTGRMDSGYGDFARWFLEQSDTGYCVHFATAATVLLRAADIPARYVEGFMFRCEAGQETTVTERSAHAWAEYYADGAWHVLEATPADASGGESPGENETPEPTANRPDLPDRDDPSLPQQPEAPETRPAAGLLAGDGAEKAPFVMPGWLKIMLWLIFAAAAAWGQSVLRIRLKAQLWNRGDPNRQALNRWGILRQLAGLAKLPIPDALEMLAQKARFSQHTLTEEELDRFDTFRAQCREQLRQRSAVVRCLLRLIFAVDNG